MAEIEDQKRRGLSSGAILLLIFGGLAVLLVIAIAARPSGDGGPEVRSPKGEARWVLEKTARNAERIDVIEAHFARDGDAPGKRTICGTVNGENAYGGMTGPHRFVVLGETATEEIGSAEGFKLLWDGAGC